MVLREVAERREVAVVVAEWHGVDARECVPGDAGGVHAAGPMR